MSLYYKSYLACSVISEYTRVCPNYELGSPSVFLDFLQQIFQYASESKLPMILVGDLNINLMLSDSWQLESLDVVQSHGYENAIECPTRVTSETKTLIDLCLTNAMRNDVVSGALTVDLSDHLPLFCFVPCVQVVYNKTNITNPYYRDINDYSIERFATLVSATHGNDIYNEPNPSNDKFMEKIKQAYEDAFPFRKAKRHKRSRKPWITVTLLTEINERN